MLELDLLLNAYLDKYYRSMTPEQGDVFNSLLNYPDQVLLDLLMGNMQSSDAGITEMVAEIRQVQHQT